MTGAALIARAIASLATAIRSAASGPVSHLCCMDGETPRLVVVVWGRIYWRKLDGDWLAGQWVPLELPGEGASERRTGVGVEPAKVKPGRGRGRR